MTRDDWRSQRALRVADGYRVTEKTGGALAEGDIRFDIVFVERTHAGARHVEFLLAEAPAAAHEERLGPSHLIVGPDARARLELSAR